MQLPSLQTLVNLFGKHASIQPSVIVCPDGETFHFGNPKKCSPLVLYIKNPTLTKNITAIAQPLESSYLSGHWDCNNIPKLLTLLQYSNTRPKVRFLKRFYEDPICIRKQSQYPNDILQLDNLALAFHSAWLDPSLAHGIAAFSTSKSEPLYIAQQRRAQSILRLLQSRRALKVLDTHAGWGAFVEKASLHYDVSITAASPARAQFCQERLLNIPTPINYQVKTTQYKHEHYYLFDAAVGILPNIQTMDMWQQYMLYLSGHLRTNGISVIQLVTDTTLPYHKIGRIAKQSGLRILEHQILNKDAEKTYRYWLNNFCANYDQLLQHGFSAAFLRQWQYYLSEMSNYFSGHSLQARQYILEKYI